MKNKSANVKVFYLLTIVNCWRKADILINNNDYIVELNYLELDIEHKEEIQRVKTDHVKMLEKFRAKSRIVVLGNHEDRVWSKSDRFAPVLRGDSLRFLVSLAVEKRRPLRQGDCKNAFCHGVLPPDETTIVRPPSGDPEADPQEYWLLLKTLYGLRRSPRHWFDKINAIFLSIGLTPSLEDPCLYSGFVTDPKDPSNSPSQHPLTLGLYVDDFVYFSEDPAVESLFCRLLGERCKVDFMGIVEWFLGVHFSWRITPSSVAVHLNQSGFASNLVESFFGDTRNPTPTATPYRNGVPIDSIAPSTDADDSPAQIRRKEAYQSLIGSIGWLAHTTRPDLSAVHSFLASYSNKPAVGHMKAALYALPFVLSLFQKENILYVHIVQLMVSLPPLYFRNSILS